MRRRVFALLTALALAASGCDSCSKPKPALLADASPPPRFDKPARKPDPRFADDRFWAAASSDDPLDLSALADQEGATGLLEGLEQGGDTGRIALRAMAYAPDAELVIRRLAEVVLQTDDETQQEILVTIRGVVQNMKAGGEPLDPGGTDVCVAALLHIAKDGSPARNRLAANAALHALAHRGALDPANIPAAD